MTTNTITADGNSRFSTNSLTDYIFFDNRSAVVGENAGDNLNPIYSYYNTLLGYKSGERSVYSYFNTFIGSEAGANIQKGTSNIIIGKEYMKILSNNTYSPISTSNIISLGINNKTSDNSISIGHSNSNIDTYGLSIGRQNIIKGKWTNCIGNDNRLIDSSESIIIGNKNGLLNVNSGDNVLVIGNSNLYDKTLHYEKLLSKKPIIIGNNLNNDNESCTINIGDTFVKYDDYVNNEYVLIGAKGNYSNLPNVTIGFDYTDITCNIINTSNNASLYVKNGIMADKIILGNYSSDTEERFEVSIGVLPNLGTNIQYYLPNLPDNPNNMFLTTSNNGEMYWKYISTLIGGGGDNGGNEGDGGLSLLTTDDLPQGNNNLYFTNQNFDNRFDYKISNTTLDEIQNGTTNTYIKNGIYNRDLVIFGTLTVNKIRVLGVNFNPDTTLEGYIEDVIYAKTIGSITALETENSNLKVQLEKNNQDILVIQQKLGI